MAGHIHSLIPTPTPTAVAGYGFHRLCSICLSVYQHAVSQTDAAGITELDIEMFQRES